MCIDNDGITKLSVVIPVYNKEETIEEVIDRVCAVDLGDIKKESIISNDGSTDATPKALEKICQNRLDILRVYTSPINLGKGAAVRLGMGLETGDVIIIQDAGLELNPNEYIQILKPIIEHRTKVVYGSRFLNPQPRISPKTRLANRFLTTLTNLLFRGHLTDMETAYKAFRKDVLRDIHLRCVRFDFEPEITAKLLMAGYSVCEVPISYNPRTAIEGKKISWVDGIEAIFTLLRCRYIDPRI